MADSLLQQKLTKLQSNYAPIKSYIFIANAFANNRKSSAQNYMAGLYFFDCKNDAQFHGQLEDIFFMSH